MSEGIVGQIGHGLGALAVGVRDGRVVIGRGADDYWALNPHQAEDFAQLFVRACWQAAAHSPTDAQRAELKAAGEEIQLTPGRAQT